MNNDFIISNFRFNKSKLDSKIKIKTLKGLKNVYYYGKSHSQDGIEVIIDGYVIPRNIIYNDYKCFSQHELIIELYKKYKKQFVKKIKGFFTVIVITSSEIVLVNDIHSVKRVSYWKQGDKILLSNNQNIISQLVDLSINPYAPSMIAIFQHFVGGYSLFQNVYYSLPASILTINEMGFFKDIYLSTDYFARLDREKFDNDDFHNIFLTSIKNVIDYLQPKSISTTLTGGRDTRSILATLLYLNIMPHCFTFGHSAGIDVQTSHNITKHCGLSFSNHFIDKLDEHTYSNVVNKIIESKNSFIHIHRAHRLDAILKERIIFNGSIDMVFVGAMGGDYIMGEHFNDYILSEFIRRYLVGNESKSEIYSSIFNKHYIKYNASHISFIEELLNSLGLRHNKFNKDTEFNLVHNIIGGTHDIQDINLFLQNSKYVIAPFMDIDVMEALFSSRLSLFSNTRHTKNPFVRLRGGELQCSLIRKFAPELATIPFANLYTPNDVLGNRLIYVLKRIYLQKVKVNSKPTFSYDAWFIRYVNNNIKDNNRYQLKEYYYYSKLLNDLADKNHLTHEGYWHKFTNPIMLNLYLKSFLKITI